MKYSFKQPPPLEFTQWLELENPDWKPSYNTLAGEPMNAVRQSLLNEQGWVCCYCGRRLPADGSDGHIDHFWPQSHFNGHQGPDRTLDYSNFFRSCGPARLPGVPLERPTTCGEAKGDWFDENASILPSDIGCEARFVYGQSGSIDAVASGDQAANNMIKRLALDDAALRQERARIIADVEQALADGATAEDELHRARAAVDGKLPGFGHVTARYLEVEFDLIPEAGS